MSFATLASIGFLFGIGMGYCVQRAGLCFAHGLGEIFMGRGRRIGRMFLVIFAITCAGFLLSGWADSSLGPRPIGQIRGYGFFNVLSGVLFGAGILLTGGCVLGTLRQIGEGNLTYFVVLLALIPGMALVVYGLDPVIGERYDVQARLLTDITGLPAAAVATTLVAAALVGLLLLRRRAARRAD